MGEVRDPSSATRVAQLPRHGLREGAGAGGEGEGAYKVCWTPPPQPVSHSSCVTA
jgi:hypothetical protein